MIKTASIVSSIGLTIGLTFLGVQSLSSTELNGQERALVLGQATEEIEGDTREDWEIRRDERVQKAIEAGEPDWSIEEIKALDKNYFEFIDTLKEAHEKERKAKQDELYPEERHQLVGFINYYVHLWHNAYEGSDTPWEEDFYYRQMAFYMWDELSVFSDKREFEQEFEVIHILLADLKELEGYYDTDLFQSENPIEDIRKILLDIQLRM
ncbi:hypothetical protein [Alkalihalobacillus alcalophilus]|nr:hypothetical protein [Alkalihalobacillus alcalophilus]